MKKFVFAIAIFAYTTDANAYCARGLSIDYNDTIAAEFKYLICLHNEQNASLNQMTDVINNQRSLLIDMSTAQQRLQSRLDQAEREIENLKARSQ